MKYVNLSSKLFIAKISSNRISPIRLHGQEGAGEKKMTLEESIWNNKDTKIGLAYVQFRTEKKNQTGMRRKTLGGNIYTVFPALP